jgi:hypothetical protein
MKSERRSSIGKQEWVHWNSPEIFDKEMARQLSIADRPREDNVYGYNRRGDSEVRG